MSNIVLSEARVKALRPRPSTYDIRDAKLRGFGLRVLSVHWPVISTGSPLDSRHRDTPTHRR